MKELSLSELYYGIVPFQRFIREFYCSIRVTLDTAVANHSGCWHAWACNEPIETRRKYLWSKARENACYQVTYTKNTAFFSLETYFGNKQVEHILFLSEDEHYDLFLFVLEMVDTVDFF